MKNTNFLHHDTISVCPIPSAKSFTFLPPACSSDICVISSHALQLQHQLEEVALLMQSQHGLIESLRSDVRRCRVSADLVTSLQSKIENLESILESRIVDLIGQQSFVESILFLDAAHRFQLNLIVSQKQRF